MPSSYPTTPAPVPPGVTRSILPGPNAPAVRSGPCFFFVGPVLSGYFIPLFFIRGGYQPQAAGAHRRASRAGSGHSRMQQNRRRGGSGQLGGPVRLLLFVEANGSSYWCHTVVCHGRSVCTGLRAEGQRVVPIVHPSLCSAWQGG